MTAQPVDNYGYIYRTTDNTNHKTYIGQHVWHGTKNYLGSGTLLKAAVAKRSKNNFSVEVLESLLDLESLNEAEKRWIALERASGKAEYNIADGGAGIGSEALKKLWTSELKERQAATVTQLWLNSTYRASMVKAATAFWSKEENRSTQASKMVELWKNDDYATASRERLYGKDTAARRQISLLQARQEPESIAKTSSSIKLHWHKRHLKSKIYDRFCFSCTESGLSISINIEEFGKIQAKALELSASKLAKEFGISINKASKIKNGLLPIWPRIK